MIRRRADAFVVGFIIGAEVAGIVVTVALMRRRERARARLRIVQDPVTAGRLSDLIERRFAGDPPVLDSPDYLEERRKALSAKLVNG